MAPPSGGASPFVCSSTQRCAVKHFKISNRGSLNRKFLELIGLSTKRDRFADNTVIGNKGSGTKLSAVAALRLGLTTGITSHDGEGSYYLVFDTEPIDVDGTKANQVYFHYYLSEKDADGEWKRSRFPSSMVVEAFPDWDKPIGSDDKKSFKIVREHVCNARDEDKGFACEVVDQVAFAKKGETAVYLPHTDEIAAIFAAPERYFKFLSKQKPLAVVDGIGEIWPKTEERMTRLFLLGVLVDCTAEESRKSLFDYSLYNKHLLSEERILKNSGSYTYWLGKLFARLANPGIARAILEGVRVGAAQLEESALATTAGEDMPAAAKKAWLDAAHAVFGQKLALPSQNEVVNSDVVQMYKRTLVTSGDSGFKRFLEKIGVPKADDIFPSNPEDRLEFVKFEDLKLESRSRFIVAFRIFAEHFPDRVGLPVVFYHPLDESTRTMAGFAGHGSTCFEEIWIATKSRTSLPEMTSLLMTLVHESRHCVTRAYDKDREFGAKADAELLVEILRSAGYARYENGVAVPQLAESDGVMPTFVDAAARAKAKPGPTAAGGEIAVDVDETSPDDELQRLLDEIAKDNA
ncbi:MAG: hypothetical protein RL272_389 [Candidatus Parcubacteria bacterium]